MSWQEKLSKAERQQLVTWARRAVYGLNNSAVFCGLLGNGPLDAARIEFTLQLGHALLNDKLIVLPVPIGFEVPPKLAAVADRIVRYDPSNLETLQVAVTQALTELGINTQ